MDALIRLTKYEIAVGAYVGCQRQIEALESGASDQHGYEGEPWSTHIEGACAEIAAARHLHLYWEPTVNTFKRSGDIGRAIEIRHCLNHNGSLIIRPGDPDDANYILVTGSTHTEFAIHGWILGSDAKTHLEWWKTHTARRPFAWFVPSTALKSTNRLPKLEPYQSEQVGA